MTEAANVGCGSGDVQTAEVVSTDRSIGSPAPPQQTMVALAPIPGAVPLAGWPAQTSR